MQKELIAQLRAKHESAAACLTLINNATDADMKNIASQWYESYLIDLIEMQVPESEKPEYHNLDMSLADAFDYAIADEEERARPKIRIAMHEEISFSPVAHSLSY